MIIEERTIYQGWTTLKLATLQMADGGREERHVEDHGQAVAVLPYDPERRMLLIVSMPRAPVLQAGEQDLLEAVAGRIEDEEPEVCARREALEEAGVRLAALEFIGKLWSMPGLSTERLSMYLAPYHATDRVSEGGGAKDENEQIRVRELPFAEAVAMADAGLLTDMKTFLLLQALRLRHPVLFT
jgi:nudix-type nucleoside diphosphatase (YffH/AdpP family)